MRITFFGLVFLGFLFFLNSCSIKEEPVKKNIENDTIIKDIIQIVEPKTKTFLNEGTSLFKSNCATCHGVILLRDSFDFSIDNKKFITHFRQISEHKKLSQVHDSSLIIIRYYFSKPVE